MEAEIRHYKEYVHLPIKLVLLAIFNEILTKIHLLCSTCQEANQRIHKERFLHSVRIPAVKKKLRPKLTEN